MGAIAHLEGKRSFTVVDHALTSVSCMTHRGAVDADMKTGDGSGILSQIPFPLFTKAAEALDHKVSNPADLAVGVFFFPAGNDKQAADLLADWETTTRKLVRVIAKERAELEAAEEQHEAASTPK